MEFGVIYLFKIHISSFTVINQMITMSFLLVVDLII